MFSIEVDGDDSLVGEHTLNVAVISDEFSAFISAITIQVKIVVIT